MMTNPELLNAMLMTRRQMTRCIDRFDALLYNPYDRGFTEQGLDQVVLETIRRLRRLYLLRTGIDADVP